jgi:hypothetical protein
VCIFGNTPQNVSNNAKSTVRRKCGKLSLCFGLCHDALYLVLRVAYRGLIRIGINNCPLSLLVSSAPFSSFFSRGKTWMRLD